MVFNDPACQVRVQNNKGIWGRSSRPPMQGPPNITTSRNKGPVGPQVSSVILWAIIAGSSLSGWFTVADVGTSCCNGAPRRQWLEQMGKGRSTLSRINKVQQRQRTRESPSRKTRRPQIVKPNVCAQTLCFGVPAPPVRIRGKREIFAPQQKCRSQTPPRRFQRRRRGRTSGKKSTSRHDVSQTDQNTPIKV